MESQYLIHRRGLKNGTKEAEPKKQRLPIAKKSVNMKLQDKEFKKFAALFLSRPENKYCAIQIDENCTRIATTINHLKRRGKANLMNEKDCEPSCAWCNNEIEKRDGWAREQGHLKSKF